MIFLMRRAALPRIAIATLGIAACDHFSSNVSPLIENPVDLSATSLSPRAVEIEIRDTTVLNAGGPASDWVWSTSDSGKAAVRQDGRAIGRSFGVAVITARSVSDPSITKTGSVLVEPPSGAGFPTADIEAVVNVSAGVPTDPDALRGAIDVHLRLYSVVYTVPRTADLLWIRASGDTVIGSTVAPSTTGEWIGAVRWNTNTRTNGLPAFPNGRYRIAVRMSTDAGPVVTSDTVQVIVRNP